jgi:hypothetical protein
MSIACQAATDLCEDALPSPSPDYQPSTPKLSTSRPRSPFTFDIPPDQAAAYARHASIQSIADCRQLLDAMQHLAGARKILPECRRLSSLLQRRWSPASLRAAYYKFIGKLPNAQNYPPGDWRICLNKSKARLDPAAAAGDRFRFTEFWRTLGETHHQDWAAAHRELLHIWKTQHDFSGKSYSQIPGYATWPPECPATGHPAGWSYSVLMRHQSSPYDQVAARIGYAKAALQRLPVLTTRVGLDIGQFFEFDDHEFNQKLLYQRRPMRPIGFGVIDIFSDCNFLPSFKPTLWDLEEEKKRKLTQREFMWYVIAVHTTIGYRADLGTENIIEKGTATYDATFEERLSRVSNGKITTWRGTIQDRPAHAGQFKGRSKGNFKTKPLIEGHWRLVDDAMDHIAGQMGKSRDDCPEQLAGMEQYTGQLMRSLDKLPLDQREAKLAQVQFPFPLYHAWREQALDAFHRINTAHDHDLEGWEKLGFVQPIWRFPSVVDSALGDSESRITDHASRSPWLPWQSFLGRPPAQQGVVKAMLDNDPSLTKPYRLSRQEVWNAGVKKLTKLPMELLPELVGPENALNAGAPLTVRRGLISFECEDIDPDPLHFYARNGSGEFLPNDEKYICFVNPYAPTHLVACTYNSALRTPHSALKVAAVCARYIPALRTDEDAINHELGAQSAYESQARVRLNLRHSDAAESKRAMFANNTRLLGDPRAPSQTSPTSQAPANDCTQDLLAREAALKASQPDWE